MVPTDQDIADQRELLVAHRQTLYGYLRQQAMLGVENVSPAVINGINATRAEIRRIKKVLRDWGETADDHPNDEASHAQNGNLPSLPVVAPVNFSSSPQRTSIGHGWLWLPITIIIFISVTLSFLGGGQATVAKLQPTIETLQTSIAVERTAVADLQSTIEALQTHPMAVDATKDWQSTGISIKGDDKVTIRVVGGKWTSWRKLLSENVRNQLPDKIRSEFPAETWLDMSDENDGSGESRPCSRCPVKGYIPSALVAKVGNTEYGIGNSCGFKAISDGELSLRINDDELNDNSGVLLVEITIGQGFNNTNSPTCGIPVN
jgi:hypothetical protein